MGSTKKDFNRSAAKQARRDANKNKQTKSLKNKLRDVQRLLKKSDLPATVRVVQERMLDLLKEGIKDRAKEEKEKKIMKRSFKVKFFEKRKLFRRYKTCLRKLEESECEKDEARKASQKELEEIKLQWNYIIHFPRDTKYISLFPLTSYTNEEVRKKQEQILKVISKKVRNGELKDASTTIGQFGSGSKEQKTRKLRLTEEIGQSVVKEERDEGSDSDSPPKLNLDDDFFIDSDSNTGPPASEEDSKKKKRKTTNKRKRSQFKFEKN